DFVFRCPAGGFAGYQADADVRVWQYEFGWPGLSTGQVGHSSELKYVFGQSPVDEALKAKAPIQSYWTNFAKTGTPNGKGLPGWAPFSATNEMYLEFAPAGNHLGKNLRGDICRLILSSYPVDPRRLVP